MHSDAILREMYRHKGILAYADDLVWTPREEADRFIKALEGLILVDDELD